MGSFPETYNDPLYVTSEPGNVPSSHPGREDFPAGQVIFLLTCPMGNSPRNSSLFQTKSSPDTSMQHFWGKQNV